MTVQNSQISSSNMFSLPHWTTISNVEYQEEEKSYLVDLLSNKIPDIVKYQILTGVILNILKKEILIDIAYKSDVVILYKDFIDIKNFKIGDSVELYIESREDCNGKVVVSRKKAILVRAWERIKDSLKNGSIIEGIVQGLTKGGLIIDVDGIICFLPETQIISKIGVDSDSYIGKAIDLIVLKINNLNNNVVVSHKAIVDQGLEQQRESILDSIEKGAVLKGVVKNIPNFGAFIDLGGVVGLLHITDIRWGRISHPSEVLEIGQEVNVVVLDFDKEQRRISLGMKQLSPHPWSCLPEDFEVGSKVKGIVVCIKDYGIFIEIKPGLEGLIHTTEMGWSFSPEIPNKVYSLGDTIEAVILELNKEDFKLGLSIKKLSSDPWKNSGLKEKYIVGSVHKGRVSNITKFGSFIEVEPGIDGLLHNSDLSWTEKIDNASSLFKQGDEIEVQILSLDIENQKLSLGYKQLKENPYETYKDVLKVGAIVSGILTKFTKASRGAIIKLECGIEAFAKKDSLNKDDGSEMQIGERANFKVISYLPESFSVMVSHRAIYDDSELIQKYNEKEFVKGSFVPSEKEVRNNIFGLEELKTKFLKKDDK